MNKPRPNYRTLGQVGSLSLEEEGPGLRVLSSNLWNMNPGGQTHRKQSRR